MKVMFDTNVFNHLVEGSIALEAIPAEWEPIITHLQQDEIGARVTNRNAMRSKLS